MLHGVSMLSDCPTPSVTLSPQDNRYFRQALLKDQKVFLNDFMVCLKKQKGQ